MSCKVRITVVPAALGMVMLAGCDAGSPPWSAIAFGSSILH